MDPDGVSQESMAKRSLQRKLAMQCEMEEELILKTNISINYMKGVSSNPVTSATPTAQSLAIPVSQAGPTRV